MKRIARIVSKEFRQIRRDRRMLPIIFISPVIQLLLLGYAANLDVRDVPAVICDMDGSRESRALREAFFASGHFSPAGYTKDYRDADGFLDRGEAVMVLAVPRGYGSDVSAGRTARIQLLVDGSDSNSAGIGMSYALSVLANHSRSIAVERLERGPKNGPGRDGAGGAGTRSIGTAVVEKTRVWYNPELKSRNFFVPGILALLLMVMTMLLTSLAVVKEKEKGTLEQLIVTPIRPLELVIGKLLPFAAIGMFDVMLVLFAARSLFGLRAAGSVLLLFGLSAIFLLTTLGLGLFVSTISRTQQQAMMTSVFFVLMPMIFLSGFVFPIENMPPLIQGFSYLLPLRYYFVIIRGIFLKGAGLAALGDETLALLIFGVLILTFSVLRFHKRLE
jgi:ABC-2 type transport system permease protein